MQQCGSRRAFYRSSAGSAAFEYVAMVVVAAMVVVSALAAFVRAEQEVAAGVEGAVCRILNPEEAAGCATEGGAEVEFVALPPPVVPDGAGPPARPSLVANVVAPAPPAERTCGPISNSGRGFFGTSSTDRQECSNPDGSVESCTRKVTNSWFRTKRSEWTCTQTVPPTPPPPPTYPATAPEGPITVQDCQGRHTTGPRPDPQVGGDGDYRVPYAEYCTDAAGETRRCELVQTVRFIGGAPESVRSGDRTCSAPAAPADGATCERETIPGEALRCLGSGATQPESCRTTAPDGLGGPELLFCQPTTNGPPATAPYPGADDTDCSPVRNGELEATRECVIGGHTYACSNLQPWLTVPQTWFANWTCAYDPDGMGPMQCNDLDANTDLCKVGDAYVQCLNAGTDRHCEEPAQENPLADPAVADMVFEDGVDPDSLLVNECESAIGLTPQAEAAVAATYPAAASEAAGDDAAIASLAGDMALLGAYMPAFIGRDLSDPAQREAFEAQTDATRVVAHNQTTPVSAEALAGIDSIYSGEYRPDRQLPRDNGYCQIGRRYVVGAIGAEAVGAAAGIPPELLIYGIPLAAAYGALQEMYDMYVNGLPAGADTPFDMYAPAAVRRAYAAMGRSARALLLQMQAVVPGIAVPGVPVPGAVVAPGDIEMGVVAAQAANQEAVAAMDELNDGANGGPLVPDAQPFLPPVVLPVPAVPPVAPPEEDVPGVAPEDEIPPGGEDENEPLLPDGDD